MRRWIQGWPAVLLLASAAYGQSLGDVARQNREKQKAKDPAATKKVITNENLPAGADDGFTPPSTPGAQPESPGSAASSASVGGKQSAAEWKSRIQAQKDAIANLQGQVDKLNASIHFVVANEYYNGVQYNEAQVRKQQQVEQMQRRLAEEKSKLEKMQEAARQAGMGSAVYDP
jgi:hypothetical protein